MKTTFKENCYTVSDVAEKYRKTTGRIRQIALQHDIGTCISNRIRIFSESDVEKIDAIISENGRNRKNSEYCD